MVEVKEIFILIFSYLVTGPSILLLLLLPSLLSAIAFAVEFSCKLVVNKQKEDEKIKLKLTLAKQRPDRSATEPKRKKFHCTVASNIKWDS